MAMIHRADHQEQFVLVTNAALRDKSISLAARGLLAYMLTFADEWSFNFEAITEQTGASRYEVRQTINELKDAGYIQTRQEKSPTGQFLGKTYDVYEDAGEHRVSKYRPSEIPTVGNTDGPKPDRRKNRRSENRTLKNTNIYKKTNSKKTNSIKKTKEAHGEFENVLLTPEEYQKLGERIGDTARDGLIEELSCYLQNHPNKYKDHYATILTWARKRSTEKPRQKPEPIAENPFTALRRQEGFEL